MEGPVLLRSPKCPRVGRSARPLGVYASDQSVNPPASWSWSSSLTRITLYICFYACLRSKKMCLSRPYGRGLGFSPVLLAMEGLRCRVPRLLAPSGKYIYFLLFFVISFFLCQVPQVTRVAPFHGFLVMQSWSLKPPCTNTNASTSSGSV